MPIPIQMLLARLLWLMNNKNNVSSELKLKKSCSYRHGKLYTIKMGSTFHVVDLPNNRFLLG